MAALDEAIGRAITAAKNLSLKISLAFPYANTKECEASHHGAKNKIRLAACQGGWHGQASSNVDSTLRLREKGKGDEG